MTQPLVTASNWARRDLSSCRTKSSGTVRKLKKKQNKTKQNKYEHTIGHNLAVHGDEIYLKALITRKGKLYSWLFLRKKKTGRSTRLVFKLCVQTSRIASSMLEITLLETTLICLSEWHHSSFAPTQHVPINIRPHCFTKFRIIYQRLFDQLCARN